MKAMIYTQYGSPDVLQLKEREKPTPKENEVLVQVHAASVNAADWHLLRGDPFLMRLAFGLFKPKNTILGADIAGRVEAVGKNVQQFKPGDEVFGDISSCGFGGFAEYAAVPEQALVKKSARLTFEQAAATGMAATTALQGLRDKGHIQAGQHVLINGASGGVGTFAVQIAKSFGAEVTAVCSTQKVELARSLGADHVIDYTREDFTRTGKQYDLIIAANGNQSIMAYKRALRPGGRYVMTGGAMNQIFQAMLLGPFLSLNGKQTFGNLYAVPNRNDLIYINELVEAGTVTPVIERCYPLNELPEALKYLEAGHARGKIIITISTP